METILITGGAGFIGTHTAKALCRSGYRVRILDLLDPQVHGLQAAVPKELTKGIEFIKGDVRNQTDVSLALVGIHSVFHFAAYTGVGQSMYNLRDYADVNVVGTANLLEGILKRKRPLRRLVLASSRAVYGEGTHRCSDHGLLFPGPRHPDQLNRGDFSLRCPSCDKALQAVATAEQRPLHPLSVYAWTKRQQEELVDFAAQAYGLPAVILRYFNVYGSGQSLLNPYTGIASIFFSRLREGKPIVLYEQGKPLRDFVHVADVTNANLKALETDLPPGTCLNIGSGRSISINNMACALARAIGVAPRIEKSNVFRAGDIRACVADLSRARALLGYTPQVSLREGLAEFVAWASGQVSVDRYDESVAELRAHGLYGGDRRAS